MAEDGADPGPADANAAWVEIELPWPPARTLDFAGDLERLYRLNPHVEVEGWQAEAGGAIRMRLHDELAGIRHERTAALAALATGDGWRLEFSGGLKGATEIRIAPQPGGSRLLIRDDYRPVSGPDDPRLAEVDRSLTAWGHALRRHALARERWGCVPGWTRFVDRFWLTMSPRNRRISWLIVWTTAIEFAVFLFVLAIYWIENLRART